MASFGWGFKTVFTSHNLTELFCSENSTRWQFSRPTWPYKWTWCPTHNTCRFSTYLSIILCTDRIKFLKWEYRGLKEIQSLNWNVTLKSENEYRENMKELYFLQRTLPCLALIPTRNPNSKVHNSKIDWRRCLLLTS